MELNDIVMENKFHYPLLRTDYSRYYAGIPGLNSDKDEVVITTAEYVDYMDSWLEEYVPVAVDLYGDSEVKTQHRLMEDLFYYSQTHKI